MLVGICAFHVSDCIGDRVGKGSAESACYDRLLRWLRQKFAFGTGRLILRAVAKRFESHAASYEGRAQELDFKATEMDVRVNTCVAARLFRDAERMRTEAAAL